ncbi:MAG: immunoglobulin domain-containing protein [Phycisphaerales bacterium]
MLASTVGPGSRSRHASAFDAATATTVVYGGSITTSGQTTVLSDTWTWDGMTWTKRATVGPSARRDSAMVYDAARARLILFGGASDPVGETWLGNSSGNAPMLVILQGPAAQVASPGQTAMFTVAASGFGTLTYRWRHNGIDLVNGGPVAGAQSPTLTISPVACADSGYYNAIVSDACGGLQTPPATLNVLTCPTNCYANCDGSTIFPALNVNDFICFNENYAAGCSSPPSCYANCDQSTTIPFLNVLDFICFMNAFAAGCS